VTFGECLVALVGAASGPLAEQDRFERHVAGAEANVAVGLARLGHRVALVGRLGDDGLGAAILRRLRGEGIDVVHLTVRAGGATGLLIRERRGVGPSEVVYYRAGSAGATLGPGDVEAAADLVASARRVHFSGVTPALSATARAATLRALELADTAGVPISLDVNLRRRLWTDAEAAAFLGPLLPRVDLLLGSPDELAVVAGGPAAGDPLELARRARGQGARTVVVKLGAGGALALGPDHVPVRSAAVAVAIPLDPVGAGDAFAAGFLAATLEGRDTATALAWANACGAAAVAAVGDLAGLPTRPELERLLASATHETIR
jgi:2-dehydro-3-deoxygluconokinase